jgi:hypothetical protein
MRCIPVLVTLAFLGSIALGQSAQLSGLVKDKTDAVVPSATVTLSSMETGVTLKAKSGTAGLYVFSSIGAGRYSLSGEAAGFDKTVIRDIRIEVAAYVSQDIVLKVKTGSETVMVTSAPTELTETTAAVSTVMDRQLIQDAPLNGRSLETLFELTPGVVLNAGGNPTNGGGFSVNGQRPTANYLMIDGASGNIYAPATGGFNMTGAGIATSASGGTNGLLPIDAVEEFRMQTSTYDASYGRTPGGQIEVKTRSGTNQFHGTLFENFRNQVMDAQDWFNNYYQLKQPPLRMNDFGGTFGGPIIKNKLFVFVAHETLLMHQPQSLSYEVPNGAIRASTAAEFQPYVAAYPIGDDNQPAGDGFSDLFSQGVSNVIVDHTTSARVDAELPKQSRAFVRINDAPSHTSQLPTMNPLTVNTNIFTLTGGVTSRLSSRASNEFTTAYGRDQNSSSNLIGSFGGNNAHDIMQAAGALIDLHSANLIFQGSLAWPYFTLGPGNAGGLSQLNILDTFSITARSHAMKFGVDLLRKRPSYLNPSNGYFDAGGFTPSNLQAGIVDEAGTSTLIHQPNIHLTNVSLYATDTWRTRPWLTLDYGVRWDFNPPPAVDSDPGVPELIGSPSDIQNISVNLTKGGIYKTRYGNIAPRLGFAATVNSSQRYKMVLRGGAGIFFDTGTAATVSQVTQFYPYYYFGPLIYNIPYQSLNFQSIAGQPGTLPQNQLYLVAPNLLSPRTYQWSLTVEQGLGANSSLAASYVGNRGDQLIKSDYFSNDGVTVNIPPAIISPGGSLVVVTNSGRSSYDALQLQMKARVGERFETVSSYTFAHALDTDSNDFDQIGALQTDHKANSANDIRQILSSVFSYRPVGFRETGLINALTGGWTLSSITQLQSAAPLSVFSTSYSYATINQFQGLADVVPGMPTVISDASAPGGKRLNPSAFMNVPVSPAGVPDREGTSARNGYRLFGLVQWDLSGSRLWKFGERANLAFRVDAFNILNHPNFAGFNGIIGSSNFGEASSTYAGAFGGTGNAYPALNAVFSNGGPRSLQLALKLQF